MEGVLYSVPDVGSPGAICVVVGVSWRLSEVEDEIHETHFRSCGGAKLR
jgi:hypothetical protein